MRELIHALARLIPPTPIIKHIKKILEYYEVLSSARHCARGDARRRRRRVTGGRLADELDGLRAAERYHAFR